MTIFNDASLVEILIYAFIGANILLSAIILANLGLTKIASDTKD